MRTTIVFACGLLLGVALAHLLRFQTAKASSPTYISRLTNISHGQNQSTILFGDAKSISCVVENGNTVCYVISQ